MMTIGFFLKEPKKTTETMIYVTASIGGSRIKRSTGIKIKPTQWTGTKIRPLATDATDKNLKLDNIVSVFKDIEREHLLAKKALTADVLQKEFDNRTSNVSVAKKMNFLEIFEHFIETKKATNSANTIKQYKSCKKHLTEFATLSKIELDFDSIDLRFYDDLLAYFLKTQKLNSTVTKYTTIIKTFMNWAHERGYHTNLQFKKFTAEKEDSEKVKLTAAIVEKLRTTDFGNEYKNLVRDIFIICAYTGLRFIDVEQMKPEDVSENFIRLHIQKTRETINIPLLEIPKQIVNAHLEKYERIKVPTNQFCNREIKKLFEEIGFTDKIKITKHSGRKNIIIEKPGCEFLTMHYGRVFFITNSLMNGMNEEFIRYITGHKDYKSFKKYVQFSPDMVADKLKAAWQ